MKIKFFLIGILLTTLVSCVSKADYDKIEAEKNELQIELDNLKNSFIELKKTGVVAECTLPMMEIPRSAAVTMRSSFS